MSGSASPKKGKALEKAVGAIERIVFRNQPDLVGKNVTIRANKRLNDKGVHHEIDVIVYVDEGTPQQVIHAYECKNRKTPADKNDVIVFAHKLRLLRAATGTIVAAKFTSSARAQAAQEPAIKLFTFTQDFWTCVDQLQWVATSYDIGNAKTTAHFRHPHPTERAITAESLCLLNSTPTKSYYAADGSAVVVTPISYDGLPVVPPVLDLVAIKAAILDSQQHGQVYRDFTRRVMAAGVQGYFAFLRGKRVTYIGRQGDQHIEWFPGTGPETRQ